MKKQIDKDYVELLFKDITRTWIPIGLLIIAVVLAAGLIFGFSEHLRGVAIFTYAFTFGWAVLDEVNDFKRI